MSKVITIASSCRWYSVNVMACLSVNLVLGDHPKSWTFCTTFRYVFLDLEDCPVKVLPIITLISPSGGRDDSSIFPFNFSSLWSLPRKFLNFPYLMRFFICCFKSKHSFMPCPWFLWKQQYLFLLRMLGSPFIFSGHFKDGLSLICISTCSSGMFNGVYCWSRVEEIAFLLSLSFFLSCLGLFWTRTLLMMARVIRFHSLDSLPLLGYDCILCIHEVLGWMDEFSYGLRLLLIKLMDE